MLTIYGVSIILCFIKILYGSRNVSTFSRIFSQVEILVLALQGIMVILYQLSSNMAEAKELQSNLVNYKAQLQQVR